MNYQTLYKDYFNFRLKIHFKNKKNTQEVINEAISRARNIGKVT